MTLPRGINPISMSSDVAQALGAGGAEFIRQWNLLLKFLDGLKLTDAAVEEILAAQLETVAPISGGGTILDFDPISHDDSGVTPDTYGDSTHVAQVTVDEKGHVTAAQEVAISFPAASGQWALVATHNFATTAQATWDTPNLGSYTDLMVIIDSIVAASSGRRAVRVSTDNGATFLSTSGDYELEDTNGATSAQTSLELGALDIATARSGSLIINGINVTSAPKHAFGNRGTLRIDTTSAINAVRLFNTGGGNMTAGVAYLYAR